MRKNLKIQSVLSLLLFAFFFASTNLFTHVHDGPEGRVVHSHPWSAKSHNHSDGQFQLIQLLSNSIFESSEQDYPDSPKPRLVAEVQVVPDNGVIPAFSHHIIGLRAPPSLL
ncbi:MAG: hypothetical protein PUC53_00745 [Bacteroidales bacterium]|nr:hypothetical protein [Bacteroidales bacterium]